METDLADLADLADNACMQWPGRGLPGRRGGASGLVAPWTIDIEYRVKRRWKMPNVKQIGNRIRAMSGQNIGGLKFQKYGERDHIAVWRVAKV
jgi:hypothetical protein